MGVKGLYKLLSTHAAGAIKPITMSDLRDWTVCLDASMAIYQWCSVGQQLGIKNNKNLYINHIQGAFFRTVAMLNAGIKPVYVFDGVPPAAKHKTIAERRGMRDAGKSVRVPKEVYIEVARVLELMNIPIVYAPSEAESQAVYYTINGTADAVATEDTDAFALGGKFVIRGLDTAAKNMVIVDTNKALELLGLTRNKFVDLCILLGCDYTGTIPGIGPAKALALIRKWGGIEDIIKNESIKIPNGFDYVSARKEFLTPVVDNTLIIDNRGKKLTPNDIEKLREFLIETHGLSPNRVMKSLKILADLKN